MADEPTLETLQAQLAAVTAEHANAKARISELNRESQGHRLNGDAHTKAAEEAQAARDAAIAEAARIKAEIEAQSAEKLKAAEAKAVEATTKAQQKAVNADLKVAAKDAGAVDPSDVLALLDRSKLKLNDDGDVTNAAELMADLKKTKPHLFGSASTSSTAKTPPAAQAKSVKDMTDEEFDAARRNKAWRNK